MPGIQIPREAVEAGARALVPNTWDSTPPAMQDILREQAQTVLDGAARLIAAAELDSMKAELERLAAERDAIGDDDYEPDVDEGCEDEGECHTAAALATYARAISRLSHRVAELRAQL